MPSIKGEDGLSRSSRKSIKKSRSKICKYNYKNPYFNFLFEFKCLPENKSLTSKQIFKLAGGKWKELSPEDKQPYIDAARGAGKEPVSSRKEKRENDSSRKSDSKGKTGVNNKKGLVRRNKKGQFLRKNTRPIKSKPKRMRASACSNCGHRRGSLHIDEAGRRRQQYDDDNDADESESKSLSSISVTSDSASSTKSGSTRTRTKTTAFESDASSITTF